MRGNYKVNSGTRFRMLSDDQLEELLGGVLHLLEYTGLEVHHEESLEILKKERIDLVVTDIKMPNMHGVELVAKIREQHHDLPVIVCSAYKGMKADQDLEYYNVSAFMDKPVDQDALLNKIKELIA